jgi:hypothetical protein
MNPYRAPQSIEVEDDWIENVIIISLIVGLSPCILAICLFCLYMAACRWIDRFLNTRIGRVIYWIVMVAGLYTVVYIFIYGVLNVIDSYCESAGY